MRRFLNAIAVVFLAAMPAAATELELSFYTGTQSAPHSDVTGNHTGGAFDFHAGWEGKPFAMPPYYGVRATWWRTRNLGYGVEFNHAKVYADSQTLTTSGFDRLEFTDGHNLLTLNVFYRWPGQWGDKITPYVGAGAGLAIPHVDVTVNGQKTFEYQITGPAVILVAGASYAINDTWSVFTEYKGSYSSNEVDLKGGGKLKTDLITNALNVGLSYRF